MIKILIKPLSVNALYKGQRFRTPEHDTYKRQLAGLLPDNIKVGEPPYKITLEFGTCKSQDLDNNIKGFLDSLVNKYGFDDRYIYEISAIKVPVKKSHEYIKFKIETLLK
jgi:Holliday junction resolvase RusA-like endonuclease